MFYNIVDTYIRLVIIVDKLNRLLNIAVFVFFGKVYFILFFLSFCLFLIFISHKS